MSRSLEVALSRIAHQFPVAPERAVDRARLPAGRAPHARADPRRDAAAGARHQRRTSSAATCRPATSSRRSAGSDRSRSGSRRRVARGRTPTSTSPPASAAAVCLETRARLLLGGGANWPPTRGAARFLTLIDLARGARLDPRPEVRRRLTRVRARRSRPMSDSAPKASTSPSRARAASSAPRLLARLARARAPRHGALALGRRVAGSGGGVRWVGYDPMDAASYAKAFEGADAVIHLAGHGVFDGRWNAERMESDPHEPGRGDARARGRASPHDEAPRRRSSRRRAVGYYGPRHPARGPPESADAGQRLPRDSLRRLGGARPAWRTTSACASRARASASCSAAGAARSRRWSRPSRCSWAARSG